MCVGCVYSALTYNDNQILSPLEKHPFPQSYWTDENQVHINEREGVPAAAALCAVQDVTDSFLLQTITRDLCVITGVQVLYIT